MKDMNDARLKPFCVEFVETRKQRKIIMAESADDAEQQAAELWDEGLCETTRDDLTNLEIYVAR